MYIRIKHKYNPIHIRIKIVDLRELSQHYTLALPPLIEKGKEGREREGETVPFSIYFICACFNRSLLIARTTIQIASCLDAF